jgi:hypothetical protein
LRYTKFIFKSHWSMVMLFTYKDIVATRFFFGIFLSCICIHNFVFILEINVAYIY